MELFIVVDVAFAILTDVWLALLWDKHDPVSVQVANILLGVDYRSLRDPRKPLMSPSLLSSHTVCLT
jgi:hypothetical protein